MTVASVARFVFSGALPGGEIWNTGLMIDYPTPPSDATALLADMTAIVADADWGTWFAEVGNLNVAGTTFDLFTAYYYSTFPGAADFQAELALTGFAPGGTVAHPDQVSIVATTLTGLSGRRNRGRMYLPMTGKAIATASQLTDANCSDVATAVVDLIHAIASNTAGAEAAVVSSVGSTKHLITAVRCDSRPDIQRRRANRQTVLHTETVAV
uniref:Uncharacterized protein n=1 Tax=uncultured prokaryote TaxID=198431 RepID=A0A0H5QM25_9ZZZZ|nr:hypothetical protein [uncultured prokaryote]